MKNKYITLLILIMFILPLQVSAAENEGRLILNDINSIYEINPEFVYCEHVIHITNPSNKFVDVVNIYLDNNDRYEIYDTSLHTNLMPESKESIKENNVTEAFVNLEPGDEGIINFSFKLDVQDCFQDNSNINITIPTPRIPIIDYPENMTNNVKFLVNVPNHYKVSNIFPANFKKRQHQEEVCIYPFEMNVIPHQITLTLCNKDNKSFPLTLNMLVNIFVFIVMILFIGIIVIAIKKSSMTQSK